MIYRGNSNVRKNASKFFKDIDEKIILTYIQGHMGEAWVDDLIDPTMIEVIVGDFVFFGGIPKGEEAEELILNIPLNSIIYVENNKWGDLLEKFYQRDIKKIKRYAFKKHKENLNKAYIDSLVKKLPKGYSLKKADEKFLDDYLIDEISVDFMSQFKSKEDYLKRGIGYFITKENKVIAGASSYVIYDDGIEIEVDTCKDYRDKGFATIVSSALISECLDRGIYPNWDAANLISVKLVGKLGYKLNYEYEVFSINYKK
ncbi:GNAT family N-acetyltransferase [Clostridium massiliamazoniense]|uniref:GNAT family N-acetyltransferase n=1 Tax=Clostridium massiliamazoniense TaxID=1347366 RepID=UPI0006D7CE78|nr:GNAT family N-acetyltransferase [Clostridium massiliamazoniense]